MKISQRHAETAIEEADRDSTTQGSDYKRQLFTEPIQYVALAWIWVLKQRDN